MTDISELKYYINEILKYICGDIRHLQDKGVSVSFPYLFLSFAGIDFLGGLSLGFKGSSRERSCWFISNWMSKVNSNYSNSNPADKLSQASYLYKFARSGLIHMACVQRSVNVDTSDEWRQHHLRWSNFPNQIVFVHPIIFAEEFLKASQLFLDDLYMDSDKVATAIRYLSDYFDQSEQDERNFKIENLFQIMPPDSNFRPPSATGSVPPPKSFGTQSPR